MTGLYVLAGIVVLYFVVLYFERRVRSTAITQLVRDYRKLRAAMTAEIPRKPVGADHPTFVRLREHYDALTSELAAFGFRVLGDVEEYYPDGTPVGVARWIVDAEGTSSGWLAALETPKGVKRAVALLTEYAPTRYVVTNWGGTSVALTHPATIERTFFEDREPMTTMVVAHRNTVTQRGSSTATLVRTFDDAVSVMERLRRHANEWRAGVPPNDLLDQDLRGILGKLYKQFGPGVVAAMQSPE